MSEEEILEHIVYYIECQCNPKRKNIKLELVKLQGLLDLYNKEKEKNESLQKEIKLMKSININDNYISKDKIKAKIKELENLQENQYIHLDYTKKILKELLEE